VLADASMWLYWLIGFGFVAVAVGVVFALLVYAHRLLHWYDGRMGR
jgi:hypothetical protein